MLARELDEHIVAIRVVGKVMGALAIFLRWVYVQESHPQKRFAHVLQLPLNFQDSCITCFFFQISKKCANLADYDYSN